MTFIFDLETLFRSLLTFYPKSTLYEKYEPYKVKRREHGQNQVFFSGLLESWFKDNAHNLPKGTL